MKFSGPLTRIQTNGNKRMWLDTAVSRPEKVEKEDANSKRSFAASLDLTGDRAKRTLQMKMMPKIPSGTRQVNNQVGMIRTMEKESRAVKAEKERKASPQARKAKKKGPSRLPEKGSQGRERKARGKRGRRVEAMERGESSGRISGEIRFSDR